MTGTNELTIVVPTRDRPASLAETLRRLSRCTAVERVDLVVVDSAGTTPLTAEDVAPSALTRVQLLRAPRPGKAVALNWAIEHAALAPLVAVLDDDMSPDPEWIDGVLAGARDHPEWTVFGGRSYVEWPEGLVRPPWADHEIAKRLVFSVIDCGPDRVVPLGDGVHLSPSGNHFWFRRAALDCVPSFDETWMCEPRFVAALLERGQGGGMVPGAVAGHRIQAGLLERRTIARRAWWYGAELSRLEHEFPCATHREAQVARSRARRAVRALAGAARWSLSLASCPLRGSESRVPQAARAVMGIATNAERLRIALGAAG